jgi:2-dehydro-3-deoxygluconokinase
MTPPTVVALGELLLRLKSAGHERLMQSPLLEATFGGTEANVLMSLAEFGVSTSYVTALPRNPLGDAAIGELRRHRVATDHVVRSGERIGIYYLEAGAGHRASRVVYDRTGSAMATVARDAFDWRAILDGARWLHLTGITPAISESAAGVTLDAARAASAAGITVSCDYNFRANLWRWGRTAPEVMREIMAYVSIGVAGREDCQRVLGVPDVMADDADAEPDPERYRALAQRTMELFPSLRAQVITLRSSHSATRNGWSAIMLDREGFHVSRRYEIGDIVDRVGAGDAFSAGLIYGLLELEGPAQALEFATAASCLKHTIPGDANRVSVADVEALMSGDEGGRVRR